LLWWIFWHLPNGQYVNGSSAMAFYFYGRYGSLKCRIFIYFCHILPSVIDNVENNEQKYIILHFM
jgi:hypothetical protein